MTVRCYDRRGAAKRLKELLGDGAPSQHTLPALKIPYAIAPNGRATYDDPDLVAYAKAVKAKAIRRMGGRRRRTLAVAQSNASTAA
jgi:hypothetical protein